MQHKSLSQFVSEKREKLGLSQSGLAKRAGLELSEIEDIESGKELFLPTTFRQKLAKGLRVNLSDIKIHEKFIPSEFDKNEELLAEMRQLILEDEVESLRCPVCNSKLETRVVKMYDLEDNLVLHPKARCSKCPFQIK